MTEYVVLRQQEGEWEELHRCEARSATSAIRQLSETVIPDAPFAGGTYVAIPVRSFQPVTVKLETKQTLTFS